MEGLFIITALIMIAFGVFQIVLFFKVWKMTDNVSKLTEFLTKEEDKSVEEGDYYVLAGDIEKAKEAYTWSFYHAILRCAKDSLNYGTNYHYISSFYEKKFKNVGIDLDTQRFARYRDLQDILSSLPEQKYL
ncbi:MAG TPA: hypothetical protein H9818_09745 [Candidatus Phocaeicola gallistercoris]|nr:hypothetical protein [Candidatus Phocaeicola gallistercoris]